MMSDPARSIEDVGSLKALFSPAFMKTYTRFETLEKFLHSGGFKVESEADIAAIAEEDLDRYVQSESVFRSWKEMQFVARTEREGGQPGA